MDRVVHFEIPVDDLDAAKRFYGDVFGWGLTDFADGQEYVLATTAEVGPDYRPTERRRHQRGPDAPPRRRAGAGGGGLTWARSTPPSRASRPAGGSVVRPRTEIPSLGYYAYARDPQGNVIGLWEAMTPP